MIFVTPDISLHETELSENFIRSSGPGGQNVNKVSTAVELRFDALASVNLPDHVKARLRTLAGSRMTEAGIIILKAEGTRSQERNRAEALERLVALIIAAAHVQKARRKTRPTLASKKRRLDGKARRSDVKSGRSTRPSFD